MSCNQCNPILVLTKDRTLSQNQCITDEGSNKSDPALSTVLMPLTSIRKSSIRIIPTQNKNNSNTKGSMWLWHQKNCCRGGQLDRRMDAKKKPKDLQKKMEMGLFLLIKVKQQSCKEDSVLLYTTDLLHPTPLSHLFLTILRNAQIFQQKISSQILNNCPIQQTDRERERDLNSASPAT